MFTRTRGRLVLWERCCYDVGPGLVRLYRDDGQRPDLWVLLLQANCCRCGILLLGRVLERSGNIECDLQQRQHVEAGRSNRMLRVEDE